MTFLGDSRVDPEKEHHVHESPPVMTIPLIVLAILATVGGWVGSADGSSGATRSRDFSHRRSAPSSLCSRRAPASAVAGRERSASGVGIVLAYVFYIQAAGHPGRIASSMQRPLQSAAEQVLHRRAIQSPRLASAVLDLLPCPESRDRSRMSSTGSSTAPAPTVEGRGDRAPRSRPATCSTTPSSTCSASLGVAAYYVYLVMR